MDWVTASVAFKVAHFKKVIDSLVCVHWGRIRRVESFMKPWYVGKNLEMEGGWSSTKKT